MDRVNGSIVARTLSYIVAGIVALIPVHAFLTVWLASFLGHYTLLRLWKEVILILILIPVWSILWNNKHIRNAFLTSRLIRAIAIYILFQLLFGVIAYVFHGVSAEALGYALIINTRFLLFFLVCLVLARQSTWLHWHWRILFFIPAGIVIAFGILQYLFLAPDFLRHFGYGPSTIPVTPTIDNKIEFVRAQSTLRGPNPLGAYMVLVLSALVTLILKSKHWREWRVAAAVAATFVLFASASRSAWIGDVFSAVAACIILAIDKGRRVGRMIGVSSLLLVVVLGIVFVFRDNTLVENYAFHTDEHSTSAESSNEGRANALIGGLRDVAHHPFGEGPGTAGPASLYNTKAPATVAENYYVQVAQEIGIVGLLLFLFINIAIARRLWQTRSQGLSAFLLASFIGLAITNLLWHTWTDDTIAYLWWGLAGVAIAPVVLGDRKDENRAPN